MAERRIEANGVGLCTEPFGEVTDPPILLVMGIGGSMLWWEEGFCQMLAKRGRFVIRYDHRDTGRSATYEPANPSYSGTDLVADAAGVLDGAGHGVDRADWDTMVDAIVHHTAHRAAQQSDGSVTQ